MSETLDNFLEELAKLKKKTRKKESELRLKIVEPYFRLVLGTVHDTISLSEMPCNKTFFCNCKKEPLILDMRHLVSKGRGFLSSINEAAKSSDEKLSELNKIIEAYIFSGALRQKGQDYSQINANHEIEAIWRFSKI